MVQSLLDTNPTERDSHTVMRLTITSTLKTSWMLVKIYVKPSFYTDKRRNRQLACLTWNIKCNNSRLRNQTAWNLMSWSKSNRKWLKKETKLWTQPQTRETLKWVQMLSRWLRIKPERHPRTSRIRRVSLRIRRLPACLKNSAKPEPLQVRMRRKRLSTTILRIQMKVMP